MSDKKQVFLSLETAKIMWKEELKKFNSSLSSENTPTMLFLLDNFTKDKLEAKELPKSWKELQQVDGYFINGKSIITKHVGKLPLESSKDVFPTKELAEASLALSQLLQLRDVYNGDWKVDLNNKPNEMRYIIINHCNNISKRANCGGDNIILSFEKENIRNQFFTNFQDLLEIAKPLL